MVVSKGLSFQHHLLLELILILVLGNVIPLTTIQWETTSRSYMMNGLALEIFLLGHSFNLGTFSPLNHSFNISTIFPLNNSFNVGTFYKRWYITHSHGVSSLFLCLIHLVFHSFSFSPMNFPQKP